MPNIRGTSRLRAIRGKVIETHENSTFHDLCPDSSIRSTQNFELVITAMATL